MPSNKTTEPKKVWPLVLAALLILIALFLRIAPILTNTVHFSFDQGLDIIMVKQLVIDHKINLISRYSGLQGVLMGPFWTWFLAPAFILSSGNPAGNVLYMSLFSIVTAVLLTKVLLQKLGPPTATITLLFLFFAPTFITGSQVVLSPHPLIFIFGFFVVFCHEVFVERKTRFLWLLFLLLGIFFQLEIAFAIFAFFAFAMVFLFFRGWWLLKNFSFWIGVLIFILTFVPQVIFDLRHNFLLANSLTNFFIGDKNSLYQQSSPLMLRFGQRLYSFYEDATAMALYGPWYLNILVLLLSIWGWILGVKQQHRLISSWLILLSVILVTFFVGFSLYPGPIWGWYRSGLPIVYVLFLTIPLAFIWKIKTKLRPFLAIILGIFLIWGANPVGALRPFFHPDSGGVPTLRNQEAAIDQVYHLAQGRKFSYFVYTPPVYNYIWQHDFWWYGQKNYGYLPQNWQTTVPLLGIGRESPSPLPGTGLTYLIIEPDNERPGEANNWLKSYIKFGESTRRIKITGGITVEERTL